MSVPVNALLDAWSGSSARATGPTNKTNRNTIKSARWAVRLSRHVRVAMWVPLDRTCEVSPRARPIQVKSDTRRYKTQGLDVVGPAPVAGSCEVEITPRPTRHSYEQPMHAL